MCEFNKKEKILAKKFRRYHDTLKCVVVELHGEETGLGHMHVIFCTEHYTGEDVSDYESW